MLESKQTSIDSLLIYRSSRG